MEIIFPSRLYWSCIRNTYNEESQYPSGTNPHPGNYIIQAIDGERKEPIEIKDYITRFRGRKSVHPCLHVKYTSQSMIGYDQPYLGYPYEDFQGSPYHVNEDLPPVKLKLRPESYLNPYPEYGIKFLDSNMCVIYKYYYQKPSRFSIEWVATGFSVIQWHYENNRLLVDYYGDEYQSGIKLTGSDAQDIGLEWLRETMPSWVQSNYKSWTHNSRYHYYKLQLKDCSQIPYNPMLVDWFPSPRQFLRYGEAVIPSGKATPRGGGDAASRYEFKLAQQDCFLEAVRHLPLANQNSIQNLAEVISILKVIYDIKRGNISSKDIKDSLKSSLKPNNAWLKYRYMYGTGKMDASEYLSYISRKKMLRGTKDIAVSHRTTLSSGGSMNCNVIVYNEVDNAIANIWRKVHELGLEVNPYVLWDFIPFSFVVDWAYPIGDILSRISDANLINCGVYHYKSICYSLKYRNTVTMPLGDFEAQVYARWYESEPPYLNSSYWFDESYTSDPSKTTIIKRVIDAGALMVGTLF